MHNHPVFITLCHANSTGNVGSYLVSRTYSWRWPIILMISHAGLVLGILVSLTDFGDVSRLADMLDLAYG